MTCPTKKGLNLKICGFGMPEQAFYSIHVPGEGGGVLANQKLFQAFSPLERGWQMSM
jgi:hypothetical protein